MKSQSFTITSIMLTLSFCLFLSCKKKESNNPPDTPSIFYGPGNGTVNISYTFLSSASDPDDDSVAIRFDWGDGDTSNWSYFIPSGDSISMSHSWSDSGTYLVKAQAKDKDDLVSSWSAGHQIEISAEISISWIKTFGGPSSDVGRSVQPTTDGGYIITGYTRSYGSGDDDVYLIKTDVSGNLIWFKTLGDSLFDVSQSVQLTTDGGYIIIGTTSSYGTGGDVYLIKTDANGNQQWFKTFGELAWDDGRSVQQTADGGYIITGWTESFGAGGSDVYLIKTDASGNQQWYNTFGGTSSDRGYSVQQTSDGGYIIIGYTRSYSVGEEDIYLIKTDASGNQQWYKTYGGSDFDDGYSVYQTSDNGYIITGYTRSYGAGEEDVYLIKTDASGNQQWYKTYGGLADDRGFSVQPTIDGGYIIAASTNSFGAGSYDVYLIRTDASGNQQWYKTFGGLAWDDGHSVQQTTDGGYIITGWTESYGAGEEDVYLIKTDANGNVE